jgi:hypothetical protein
MTIEMSEKTPKQDMVGLPIQLVQDLLIYLGTKPHTEADPYIRGINENARRINLVEPEQK